MKPKQSECISSIKKYTFDSEKNCFSKKRSKKPYAIAGLVTVFMLGLASIVFFSYQKQSAMEFAYYAVIESGNKEFTEYIDINEHEFLFNEQDVTEYSLDDEFLSNNTPTVSASVSPSEEKNLSTSSNNVDPVKKADVEYSFVTENFNLSDEDYKALIRIVEAEATDEDIIGKILVANVVLNRVRSDRFPDDVSDVIFQPGQFSPISDGRYYSVTITSSSIEAVDRALSGEDYSNGALFFVARSMANKSAVEWFDNNLTKVYQHGVHEFFKY